jgi:hypothetical protein
MLIAIAPVSASVWPFCGIQLYILTNFPGTLGGTHRLHMQIIMCIYQILLWRSSETQNQVDIGTIKTIKSFCEIIF